jgi:myo-inositol-1(or 4)-monophosphatase
MTVPSSDLSVAAGAAEEAGRFLLTAFREGSHVKEAVGRDIKLAADIEAEQRILSILRAHSPYPVLSEEAGADGNLLAEGCHWVVDPLDGTFNFSRGIPICCVSIGLMSGGRPVLGVVYDFVTGVLYEGAKGQGCRANGRPIVVSSTQTMGQAVICTGFPLRADYSTQGLLAVARLAERFKKVRMLGSAAMSLAMVARGSADAYVERGISLWDVAGGLALVEAAGGLIDLQPAGGDGRFDVVATNGRWRMDAVGPAA